MLLGVLSAAVVEADSTSGARFLNVVMPAESAATGAGTADQSSSAALTWNPAAIPGQGGPGMAFTHLASFAGTAYEQLEAVFPQTPLGSLAARVFYVSTYDVMEVDEQGHSVGLVDNHDLLLQAVYARNYFIPGLRVGTGLKFFESRLAEYSSIGAALDLGAQYKLIGTPVITGLAVQNLGIMSAYARQADTLPIRLAAGAGVELELWSGHTLKLMADVLQFFTGEALTQPALGFEYAVQKKFLVRCGYQLVSESMGAFTAGAGVRLFGFGLDYAFQPFSVLGNNHRFTLGYALAYIRERKIVKAVFKPTPKPTAGFKPRARELTAASRQFESKVSFTPPAMDHTAKEWVFEIRDQTGQVVKRFTYAGTAPRDLHWDGYNDAGQRVLRAGQYQYVLKGDAKTLLTWSLPAAAVAVKLSFSGREILAPEVAFVFAGQTEVKTWQMIISEQGAEKTIRTIQGTNVLPAKLVWDGKDEQGEFVDFNKAYQYTLQLTYANGMQVTRVEKIQSVMAESIYAADGTKSLLISDVLFEFNSTVLKLEMMNKILAVAAILRRYSEQVRVICEGHSDEIGDESINLKLSEERAQAVADLVAKQAGVSAECISAIGFGKAKPKDLTGTETGWALNRRVEIRIILP